MSTLELEKFIDFDNITLFDCLCFEKNGIYVVIKDGRIVGLVKEN